MTAPQENAVSTHGGFGYAEPYRERTKYDKLFKDLTPMQAPDAQVLQDLAALMIDSDPAANAAWTASSTTPGDNLSIPAGFTYLGQFIDHDITFDPVSTLNRSEDAGERFSDLRTARFDLDSLYGRGPDDEPYLYDQRAGRAEKLLLDPFDGTFDLPRNSQQRALVGDPRNDVHMIISQLHVSFALFHNAVVDRHSNSLTGLALRKAAKRDVIWHYQWLVVHEYLEHLIGPQARAALLTDATVAAPGVQGVGAKAHLELYVPDSAGGVYMPQEFSAAAFRFGHSQVRPSYKLNSGIGPFPIFNPSSPGSSDFSGFKQRPAGWTVDWSLFFSTNAATAPQPSRLIDTRIAAALSALPSNVVTDGGPVTLPLRNLQRGVALGLPSGQDVARALAITPQETFNDPTTGAPVTVPDPAPLWFYCLAEAQAAGGTRLGPVAAKIVGEVLVGLLAADPDSYLNVDPIWQPTLGATPGIFTAADLVNVAHGAT